MEKIQAAIAKARATRDAQTGLPTPLATPAAVLPEELAATAAQDIAAAWAALPGFTPDPLRLREHHVVTLSVGSESAPFDGMRTRALQQMRTNGWRKLAITSPGPGCGKSTVALNLAFSLARQPDLRVILLELDLRRPTLARTLGLHPDASLAEVLKGNEALEAAMRRYGNNLAIAVNLAPARAAAELLSGPVAPSILDAMMARYAPDVVIFDMPPMLATDDTIAFLPRVDCALLVAAAETTAVKEIDNCEREIAAQTNVMGIVLNKCRYMEADYGYGY
ncbi:CpsD/CapB family tyrosine-protein kinase [Cypionkella sp. TWP1-2-1b2]|uniref:CpsD/CapB family tyrosine-protein kinase n=1 Tax=Cypionkella sp. TWP1-2-1b2 TaxID=2804675 RepID=UPI003CF92C06